MSVNQPLLTGLSLAVFMGEGGFLEFERINPEAAATALQQTHHHALCGEPFTTPGGALLAYIPQDRVGGSSCLVHVPCGMRTIRSEPLRWKATREMRHAVEALK